VAPTLHFLFLIDEAINLDDRRDSLNHRQGSGHFREKPPLVHDLRPEPFCLPQHPNQFEGSLSAPHSADAKTGTRVVAAPRGSSRDKDEHIVSESRDVRYDFPNVDALGLVLLQA
jgi:hypothetical protein